MNVYKRLKCTSRFFLLSFPMGQKLIQYEPFLSAWFVILSVCGDGGAVRETLDKSVAFLQKNQSSADTSWRGKNMMTGI